MNKQKYAVFTMDVEAFSDTDCIRSGGSCVEEDYLDGFDRYIAILNKFGIKSTLFTVGEFAPKITDRLRRCLHDGHRVALHGRDHTPPMSLTPEQFREQTRQAKHQLSLLMDTPVEGFRAPCFSLDRQRLDILRELGFCYDSSYLNFTLARHTPQLKLKGFHRVRQSIFRDKGFFEFGLSGLKIPGGIFPLSGGGYVRMIPWPIMKRLLLRCIRRGDYYVFYLHPFELTQKELPVLKQLRWYDRVYFRLGIPSYARKVEKIIHLLQEQGYRFVTFEELTRIMAKESRTTD